MERTLIEQTPEKIGQKVMLQGWVNTKRDHGKITFIDLRDRTGIVQVVGGKEFRGLSAEDVISIEGTVKERPEHLINPKLKTGTVEVEAEKMEILSESEELPLPLDSEGYEISEEVRLKYRYLDLRRPRLQNNLIIRSKYIQASREYLFSQGFTEIETPLLTETTPEGSRDFIVPSRIYPGKCFALPQSPQQYKQLLMTAGFEKYFQIARCLRDEDPRADRGFEFTQIDLEMSFVNREEVMRVVEEMTIYAVEKIGSKIAQIPFPVVTYQEAMEKYGSDKFDPRTPEEKEQGSLGFAWVIDFPFFEKTEEGGWTFTHNPFSRPIPEHEEWLLKKENIGEILTTQYDLVCNGYEVGGGSLRNYRPEMLKAVFEIMGYPEEEINQKFGHMLEAFKFGTPPHGGLAQGVERLLMTILGEDYVREVQAFPQTGSGRTSVMSAPSAASEEQLRELGLQRLGTATKADNNPYQALKNLLESYGVSYQELDHEPVHTSEEAAQIRGTEAAQGAKALVVMANKEPVMLVLPGNKKVDMKAVKKELGIKDVRMATREEAEKITGIPIGAIHPWGNLYQIPTLVDPSLGENERIAFNAGLHEKSIITTYQDYLRIVDPKIVSFAQ